MEKIQIYKKTSDKGIEAERNARVFLEKKGYTFVDKNIKYRFGELDLIMYYKKSYVFVEIKYRSSEKYGGSTAAITHSQRQRLIKAANRYMQLKKINCPARFDFIGIDSEKIIWIQNAFY